MATDLPTFLMRAGRWLFAGIMAVGGVVCLGFILIILRHWLHF